MYGDEFHTKARGNIGERTLGFGGTHEADGDAEDCGGAGDTRVLQLIQQMVERSGGISDGDNSAIEIPQLDCGGGTSSAKLVCKVHCARILEEALHTVIGWQAFAGDTCGHHGDIGKNWLARFQRGAGSADNACGKFDVIGKICLSRGMNHAYGNSLLLGGETLKVRF